MAHLRILVRSWIQLRSTFCLEQHHKKKTFRSEYLEMLRKNEIEFKEEYVFDFIEEGNSW